MPENNDNKQETGKPENTETSRLPESWKFKMSARHRFMVIAVIAGVLLLGGTYVIWAAINGLRLEFNNLAESTSANNESIADSIGHIKSRLRDLEQQQRAIEESISAVLEQQPVTNEDWALAEIEHLLIIADHRLLLEKDVETALAAMEAADRRLKGLRNPELIPVREQLVADMNRLRSVNTVDVSGMALYLADLIGRVDTLPVRNELALHVTDNESASNEVDTGGWRGMLQKVWQELKQLVVIKHEGEVRQALLLPDQEYFLYQNLRLELENARHAVLRRDTENLQTSAGIVVDWLSSYFDTGNAGVANIMETMKHMESVELRPELPGINSSLESLRAYIRARERQETIPDQDMPDAGQ